MVKMMLLKDHTKTQKVIAQGMVLGNYWEGGCGSYPTVFFYGETIEEVELQANKALKDGSIDSGMGFMSIIGAFLYVSVFTYIEIEGYTFNHEEKSSLVIGDLTDTELKFLSEC